MRAATSHFNRLTKFPGEAMRVITGAFKYTPVSVIETLTGLQHVIVWQYRGEWRTLRK